MDKVNAKETPINIEDFENLFQSILAQPELDKHLYTFVHNLSTILLCWRSSTGEEGWATGCKGANNKELFTADEAAQIEQLFLKAGPVIQSMFSDQKWQQRGGDITDGLQKQAEFSINPEDISIDRIYRRFSNYMSRIDEQNRELAHMIGPLAITSSMKMDPSIPIPIPPFRIQMPANAIVPLLNGVLEILRIIFTFAFPVDVLRKLLTVFQAGFDVARGEWKYAIFTLMGLFGSAPLLIGVVLKLLRDAWLFISPQIREQIQDDMFYASKSFFAGFLLWSFSVFAPDFIRTPIETVIAPVKELIESVNDKIDSLEEKAKSAGKPLGLDVIFARIPKDTVPSFQNIQQIQRIVQQPEIFCNPQVQSIMEPFMQIPPLRLAFELLNIPVDAEERVRRCAGVSADQDITESIIQRMKPVVRRL